jgi:hypothetical protein
MPRPIARNRVSDLEEYVSNSSAWRKLVEGNVHLIGWVASVASSALAINAANLRDSVDAIQSALSLRNTASLPREDIACTDEELLQIIGDNVLGHVARYIADTEEWHADAQWALRQWERGVFDDIRGDYIAVYQKEVLEAGDDPNELRRKWARTKGVPFQRIIVKYVGIEE